MYNSEETLDVSSTILTVQKKKQQKIKENKNKERTKIFKDDFQSLAIWKTVL